MLTPSRHERPREREETLPTFSTLHAVSWSATTAQSTSQHPVIIIIIITASLQSTPVTVKYSLLDFCAALYNVIEDIRAWRVLRYISLVFHIRTQRTRLWLIRQVIVMLRSSLIRAINWMDDNVSQKWFLLNEIVKLAELRSLNLMNFNLFHKIVLFKKRTQFYILKEMILHFMKINRIRDQT